MINMISTSYNKMRYYIKTFIKLKKKFLNAIKLVILYFKFLIKNIHYHTVS